MVTNLAKTDLEEMQDWLILMLSAKRSGLTAEEIRTFIHQQRDDQELNIAPVEELHQSI